MSSPPEDPLPRIQQLEKRLERERRAREEAENIAERATRDLYERVQELERIRVQLSEAKEQADRANQAKSAFLANMSHEIRTPLTAIIGLAYLTMRRADDPRLRKSLSDIHESGNHLLGLVSDILDLSKLEADKIVLEDVDLAIDGVLERVSTMTAARAQAQGLELAFSLDPDVPRQVRGDPVRLAQILLNYVSNAIKFTERGEIMVRVSVEKQDAESALVRFSVSDTGIGIAPKDLGRLFRPFEQVDGSNTRIHGGSGLGLAICRRLAERMDGNVGATSEPGRGSVFWFTARLRLARRPADISPRRDLEGRRVLVVDDNPTARTVIAGLLAPFPVTVETAASGAEAVAHVVAAEKAGRPFHVLLLDWRMPELDGIATARRVRELVPRSTCPAVLLITAHGREEALGAAAQAGIEVVISKPVTESSLVDSLVRAVSGRELTAGEQAVGEARAARVDDFADALRGRRVLVVDDVPMNLEIIHGLLEVAGCAVETADSGLGAVERVRKGGLDVILMDIQMPVMDGVSATQEIRRLPGCAQVPVIAVTANVLETDHRHYRASGINDIIAKPIEPATLYATVARHAPGGTGAPAAATTAHPAESFEDAPVFDVEAALGFLGGNRDLLVRSTRMFVASNQHDVEQILALIAAPDLKTASRRFHRLKGSAAMLGCRRLSEVSALLERDLKAADAKAPADHRLREFSAVMGQT
ncbi:MAG: response regulator, partial [Opitutaceae bacterium]